MKSAHEAASRALEIAERLNGPPSARPEAEAVLGACMWSMGHLRRGFELLDRAWERADRINHPTANLTTLAATVNGSFDLLNLCDYQAVLRCTQREAARPRNKESGFSEGAGLLFEVLAHSGLGQLNEVRRLMRDEPWPELAARGKSLLAVWAGNLEEAETRLNALVDFHREQERFENVCNVGWMLAQTQRLAGHHEKAKELLLEGLSRSVPGGYVAMEMLGCQCLAHVYAEMDSADDARATLARCREILAAGEDWRGLAGMVEWSEAALAVAEKRLVDADRHFALALEIMRRYSMRLWEGPALRDWARALLAAGQRERALEKFDEAIELYRRVDAGQPWIDRILDDKQAGGL